MIWRELKSWGIRKEEKVEKMETLKMCHFNVWKNSNQFGQSGKNWLQKNISTDSAQVSYKLAFFKYSISLHLQWLFAIPWGLGCPHSWQLLSQETAMMTPKLWRNYFSPAFQQSPCCAPAVEREKREICMVEVLISQHQE